MENGKRKRKWKKSTVVIFVSFLLAFGSMGVFAQTWFDLHIADVQTYYTPGGFHPKTGYSDCAYVYVNNVTISAGRTNVIVRNATKGNVLATSVTTFANTARGLVAPPYLAAHKNAVGDEMYMFMGSFADYAPYTVSGSWHPNQGY